MKALKASIFFECFAISPRYLSVNTLLPDKLANDPRGHSSQFVPEAIEIPAHNLVASEPLWKKSLKTLLFIAGIFMLDLPVYPTDPGSHSKPRQAAAPAMPADINQVLILKSRDANSDI